MRYFMEGTGDSDGGAIHWNTYDLEADWLQNRVLSGRCSSLENKSRATRCDRVALFSIESRSSCYPIKLFREGAVLPAPSLVN
jgi:hypothetical protein